eukprot:2471173-Prymnesium_polylepis.2
MGSGHPASLRTIGGSRCVGGVVTQDSPADLARERGEEPPGEEQDRRETERRSASRGQPAEELLCGGLLLKRRDVALQLPLLILQILCLPLRRAVAQDGKQVRERSLEQSLTVPRQLLAQRAHVGLPLAVVAYRLQVLLLPQSGRRRLPAPPLRLSACVRGHLGIERLIVHELLDVCRDLRRVSRFKQEASLLMVDNRRDAAAVAADHRDAARH